MHELLCVLLWLAAIVSPGSYYKAEINTIAAQNQPNVDNTLNDPTAMAPILAEYGDDAEIIVIVDFREGD